MDKSSDRLNYIHLDFARGVAAILVLIGHLRAFYFPQFQELESPGLLIKLVYFVTGFGYEAVIVFFVLSGFFITKSVCGMIGRGAWSWRAYLVHRVARLWTVLLPALLITLSLDTIAIAASNGGYYAGDFAAAYARGPTPDNGIDLSAFTFIQNVFFLQTISAPIYGSNFPLWSLAYEFWYYVLFPLAFIPFATKTSPLYKVISLTLFMGLCWFLPSDIVILGGVWLLGSAAFFLHRTRWGSSFLVNPVVLCLSVSALLFSAILVRADFVSYAYLPDFLIGFAMAIFLLSFSNLFYRPPIYSGLTDFISKTSYSLYAVHDPFLAFIFSVFLVNQQFAHNWVGYLGFFLLFIMAMTFGFIFYWLFERNTAKVDAFLLRLVNFRGGS